MINRNIITLFHALLPHVQIVFLVYTEYFNMLSKVTL